MQVYLALSKDLPLLHDGPEARTRIAALMGEYQSGFNSYGIMDLALWVKSIFTELHGRVVNDNARQL